MNPMRNFLVGIVVAATLFSSPLVQASQSARHQAQELQRSKLSLIEAIIAAEKEDGGKTTSAEFNFKRGNPAVFQVKVLSADGKKLTRYDLDPRTGRVQNTHNEVLENLLTRITPDSLRLTFTTLPHAIAIAQQHSGGHAVSADVDRHGDHLEFTVEMVKLDGTSQKVKIDSASGQVISEDTDK
jgi:uncharacterized membrane protein YkoI